MQQSRGLELKSPRFIRGRFDVPQLRLKGRAAEPQTIRRLAHVIRSTARHVFVNPLTAKPAFELMLASQGQEAPYTDPRETWQIFLQYLARA